MRELPLPEGLALRFIFPHAPVRPVTINNGHEMRAWYDIGQGDIARVPDEAGIRESRAAIERLIARERSRGVADEKIVLAGFSQGGAIALQAGLRHRERVAGIVALSTYLPLEESLEAEASGANRATPIFMGHGTQDPVIPRWPRPQRVVARAATTQWHAWPMPHRCAQEVEALGEFRALMPAAAPTRCRFCWR